MASRPISPAEHTKQHPPLVQPNAHPYAIKTTSSALLSRSNSSPHSPHHTRHHYIPSPPSRIQIGTRVRHRHSSSLSSVEGGVCGVNRLRTIPAPLPTPPPIVAASSCSTSMSLRRADESEPPHRVRRAKAIPSSATEFIIENHDYYQKHSFSHDQDSRPELYAGLPPDPKHWNTDQLATHLETSLKLGNTTYEDKDDFGLADILECVRKRGLSGCEFLRLTDADLAGTPLSDAQRVQLLECSRTLRADVLRGRIYVDLYHSHEVSDNSNEVYSQFARTSTPLHSIRGASVSADNLHLLLERNSGEGEGALPPSPAVSLHRSNSVSDASAQRYRDLARMRMRRRGRVRGLVETWERASTSSSECSASEAESESETDLEYESIPSSKGSPQTPSDQPSTLQDEPTCNVCSSADPTELPQEPPLLPPPLPYTHMHSTLGATQVEEEEPSIEELLATSPNIPLRGARAWEADFGLGETVKRISVSAGVDAGGTAPHPTEQEPPRHPQDDALQGKSSSVRSKGSGMRRSTGSRGKNANLKPRRRIVTAIFTGSPSDDASENASDQAHLKSHHHFASGGDDVVCGRPAPASLDLQNDPDSALRALEESIAVTRTQLEAFRLRLEKVEADTARQEAKFMRAQFPDSQNPPGLELRQRRSERATAESTEPPRDETFVEGSSNGDVPEGWETISLADIARAIVAKTMKWLFPFGHLGVYGKSRTHPGSSPGANNNDHSPAKRNGRFPVVRTSCSIILVSFALCATVLQRMGFGRWVRRP